MLTEPAARPHLCTVFDRQDIIRALSGATYTCRRGSRSARCRTTSGRSSSVLGSALGNLVANAFEHVERGEVTIGTTPGAIFVEDKGAGIATDLLGDVRHPFVRGDSSSGDGLGLAII